VRFSLPTSLLLHGGLLAWAFVGFSQVKPLKNDEPLPVEVAIITEDGLTRLRQGVRNSKNLEAAPAREAPPSPAVKETPKAKPPEPKQPPPPQEQAQPEPPPPPPPKPEPPPKAAEAPPPKPPEPQKDEIAELALLAEAEAKAEAQRKAAEEAKRIADAKRAEEKRKRDEMLKKRQEEARKKKQEEDRRKAELAKAKSSDDFFEDMQKALKDNDPRKRAPQPSGSPQVAQASNVKGPQAGAPEGRDTQLTGSERGMIVAVMRESLRRCWNIPAGADGADAIVTEVEFRLAQSGQLIGQPRVVSRMPTPLHQTMADNAVRAIIQCQPYTRFPPHLYKGGWDHFIWEFNPREMFR
jgi:colicin import membrane protein